MSMNVSSTSLYQFQPPAPPPLRSVPCHLRYDVGLLTPRQLHAAHHEWFRGQREQLGQFLAHTAGCGRATFSLPLPPGYQFPPQPQQQSGSSSRSKGTGSQPQWHAPASAARSRNKHALSLSRAEILNLMREAIDDFEARQLARARKRLASTQFSPITLKRWEQRLAGRLRMQLTGQVELLCQVYLCLADGLVETKLIAGQTGAGMTAAGEYRLNLLNAVLGRLLATG